RLADRHASASSSTTARGISPDTVTTWSPEQIGNGKNGAGGAPATARTLPRRLTRLHSRAVNSCQTTTLAGPEPCALGEETVGGAEADAGLVAAALEHDRRAGPHRLEVERLLALVDGLVDAGRRRGPRVRGLRAR